MGFVFCCGTNRPLAHTARAQDKIVRVKFMRKIGQRIKPEHIATSWCGEQSHLYLGYYLMSVHSVYKTQLSRE